MKTFLHNTKRPLALLLVLVMVVSLLPTIVLASGDYTGHWAQADIETAVENGWFADANQTRPNAHITRAEFVTMLNKMKGYSGQADLSDYSDMEAGAWYYNGFAAAVAQGFIKGSEGKLHPNDYITRNEAATIFANIYGLSLDSAALSALENVGDAASIPQWARSYVGAVVNAGLMAGSEGKFRGNDNITRAETAVLLARLQDNVRSYGFPGVYTGDAQGVVVASSGVTLKNMKIAGNLTITAAVGDGEVTLSGVKVEGELDVQGGGMNSVYLDNCEIESITITKDEVRVVMGDGTVVTYANVAGENNAVVIGEGAKVGNVVVEESAGGADVTISSGAQVESMEVSAPGSNVALEAGAEVKNVTVTESAASSKVDLAEGAKVENATVAAKDSNVNMAAGAEVKNFKVEATATGAAIATAEGAKIGEVTLEAEGTKMTGQGTVEKAVVKADGVEIEKAPENTQVADNVTANVGGKEVDKNTNPIVEEPKPSNPSPSPSPTVTYPTGTAKLITDGTEATDAGLTTAPWDWANQAIPGAHWIIFDYTVGNTAITVTGFKVFKNVSTEVYDSGSITLSKAAGSTGRVGIEAADASDTVAGATVFTQGTYHVEIYYTANGSRTLKSADLVYTTDQEAALYDNTDKLVEFGALDALLDKATTGQTVELLTDKTIDSDEVNASTTLVILDGKTLTVTTSLINNGAIDGTGSLIFSEGASLTGGGTTHPITWKANTAGLLKKVLNENSRAGDTIMITEDIGSDEVDQYCGATPTGTTTGYHNFKVTKQLTITQATANQYTVYGSFTIGNDSGSVDGAVFDGLSIVTPTLQYKPTNGDAKSLIYAIGGLTDKVTVNNCDISVSTNVFDGQAGDGYRYVYRGLSLVTVSSTFSAIDYTITNNTFTGRGEAAQQGSSGNNDMDSLSAIYLPSSVYGIESVGNWTTRYPGVKRPNTFGFGSKTEADLLYAALRDSANKNTFTRDNLATDICLRWGHTANAGSYGEIFEDFFTNP